MGNTIRRMWYPDPFARTPDPQNKDDKRLIQLNYVHDKIKNLQKTYVEGELGRGLKITSKLISSHIKDNKPAEDISVLLDRIHEALKHHLENQDGDLEQLLTTITTTNNVCQNINKERPYPPINYIKYGA